MSALVDDLTAGRITCGACGATTTIDRDTASMMGTIATFWDAHRDCGRIYIDLQDACRGDSPLTRTPVTRSS